MEQRYLIVWVSTLLPSAAAVVYQECSGEGNSQDTENVDPITQKWWDMMADIMEVNPDNSPVTIPIQEVFHLD